MAPPEQGGAGPRAEPLEVPGPARRVVERVVRALQHQRGAAVLVDDVVERRRRLQVEGGLEDLQRPRVGRGPHNLPLHELVRPGRSARVQPLQRLGHRGLEVEEEAAAQRLHDQPGRGRPGGLRAVRRQVEVLLDGPSRVHQHEALHQLRLLGRGVGAHEAADAVADQRGGLPDHLQEEVPHEPGPEVGRVEHALLLGAAVPGHRRGVDAEALAHEQLDHAPPLRAERPEPVHQHHRLRRRPFAAGPRRDEFALLALPLPPPGRDLDIRVREERRGDARRLQQRAVVLQRQVPREAVGERRVDRRQHRPLGRRREHLLEEREVERLDLAGFVEDLVRRHGPLGQRLLEEHGERLAGGAGHVEPLRGGQEPLAADRAAHRGRALPRPLQEPPNQRVGLARPGGDRVDGLPRDYRGPGLVLAGPVRLAEVQPRPLRRHLPRPGPGRRPAAALLLLLLPLLRLRRLGPRQAGRCRQRDGDGPPARLGEVGRVERVVQSLFPVRHHRHAGGVQPRRGRGEPGPPAEVHLPGREHSGPGPQLRRQVRQHGLGRAELHPQVAPAGPQRPLERRHPLPQPGELTEPQSPHVAGGVQHERRRDPRRARRRRRQRRVVRHPQVVLVPHLRRAGPGRDPWTGGGAGQINVSQSVRSVQRTPSGSLRRESGPVERPPHPHAPAPALPRPPRPCRPSPSPPPPTAAPGWRPSGQSARRAQRSARPGRGGGRRAWRRPGGFGRAHGAFLICFLWPRAARGLAGPVAVFFGNGGG